MESVLIISPEKAHAEQLSRVLTQQKMSCVVTPSARDGYQRILRRHPDLVLISNIMPDMKTEGLIQLIRSNLLTKNVPVIVVTSAASSTAEREIYAQTGANDYLVGPVDSELLIETVRRVLKSPQKMQSEETVTTFRPKPQPAPRIEPEPVEAKTKKRKRPSLPFLKRINEILFQPSYVFGEIEPRTDMIITVLITALIPILASLPKVISATSTFDAWISAMSLGLMTSAILWFAIAGLLHMTLPFQGEEFSLRECLIFSGLASVPKLFGAIMAAVYAVLGRMALPSGMRDFSAGLNIIPGLPDSEWVAFVSRIGIFDFWSAWLLLICMWTLIGDDDREWSATAVIVGAVALVFGALTSY